MMQKTTLLAAVWENGGNVEDIRARLENGELILTGNFKGQEAEIAHQAGDWERK